MAQIHPVYTTQMADSYLRIAARKIIKRLGLSMTPDELETQFRNTDSFYYELLEMAALNMKNYDLLDNCKKTQKQAQERLVDLNYQRLTMGGKLPPKEEEEFQRLQETFKLNAKEIKAYETLQNKLDKTVTQESRKEIEGWQKLQSEHAQKILDSLKENGYEPSPQFQERLQRRLELSDVNVEIPKETIKKLGVDEPIDDVSKAVILTILEEEKE